MEAVFKVVNNPIANVISRLFKGAPGAFIHVMVLAVIGYHLSTWVGSQAIEVSEEFHGLALLLVTDLVWFTLTCALPVFSVYYVADHYGVTKKSFAIAVALVGAVLTAAGLFLSGADMDIKALFSILLVVVTIVAIRDMWKAKA
jgi:hypothetical protein